MSNPRIAIAALSLSALAFIGIVTDESYTASAVIPTRNDRLLLLGFVGVVNVRSIDHPNL